jgi:hypothetical protein
MLTLCIIIWILLIVSFVSWLLAIGKGREIFYFLIIFILVGISMLIIDEIISILIYITKLLTPFKTIFQMTFATICVARNKVEKITKKSHK